MGLRRTASTLAGDAAALRDRFNAVYWDARGWYALALDGRGRPVDALTTNPGHALWAGIADPDLAGRYLDRLMEPDMWTGWGLRTLSSTMEAYDPLSYHNGSVWPHDTAICAAGAARYGRWDVVDRIVGGGFDAAVEFDGRPPELFAGIARTEAPMPVAYPSSCSPQAWSSASSSSSSERCWTSTPSISAAWRWADTDLEGVADLRIERVRAAGTATASKSANGTATVQKSDI